MPFAVKKKQAPRIIPVEDPGHLGFPYTIRLSQRKSAAIEIRNGKVLVAAPQRVAQRELKQWVEQKADWIRDKLEQQAVRQDEIRPPQYTCGEHWPYLGETLELVVQTASRSDAQRLGQQLIISLSSRSRKPQQEHVKQLVQQWYQQQALALLSQKTHAISEQLQRVCREVRLRRTKSKWGHCTRDGVIQYNWLIMQAPPWVVDYLVAHECCHLVHHNHSRAYWALVNQINPNVKSARLWLNQHGHKLIV